MAGLTERTEARVRIPDIMIEMRGTEDRTLHLARIGVDDLCAVSNATMFTSPAGAFFAFPREPVPILRVGPAPFHPLVSSLSEREDARFRPCSVGRGSIWRNVFNA